MVVGVSMVVISEEVDPFLKHRYLFRRLAELPLKPNTKRALKELRVTCVGDVVPCSPKRLRKHGLRIYEVNDLRKVLGEEGYTLGTPLPKPLFATLDELGLSPAAEHILRAGYSCRFLYQILELSLLEMDYLRQSAGKYHAEIISMLKTMGLRPHMRVRDYPVGMH